MHFTNRFVRRLFPDVNGRHDNRLTDLGRRQAQNLFS